MAAKQVVVPEQQTFSSANINGFTAVVLVTVNMCSYLKQILEYIIYFKGRTQP